jgi:regulator of sigma E protease
MAVLCGVAFIHEFGHLLVGRICGAKARAFSIGLGPEIFGFTDRRGTRWRLSAVPIGGYVRFAGDSDIASATPLHAGRTDLEGALDSQPLPRRAAIVVAGPIANMIAAAGIFSALAYFVGETIVPPRVGAVVAGSAAERAGFAKGDEIESVDGRPIATFPDIFDFVSLRPNEIMTFLVKRGGHEISIVATPTLSKVDTAAGPQSLGRLGLEAPDDPSQFVTLHPSPIGAVRAGLLQSWTTVRMTGEYLWRLAAGRASADQLSGPIRIAQLSKVAASFGAASLIELAGLLPLSLGLMNLLPVPMLDGGHLLFYAIEAARGRALSLRAREFSLRIGVACVLALMFFVTANDLRRLFAT